MCHHCLYIWCIYGENLKKAHADMHVHVGLSCGNAVFPWPCWRLCNLSCVGPGVTPLLPYTASE